MITLSFMKAPKKGSMSMTLENSPDLFHNNKKVFFSSSAFRSHHFSSSALFRVALYCNEALWAAEINSLQKWYFATEIVLIYCEKKLF